MHGRFSTPGPEGDLVSATVKTRLVGGVPFVGWQLPEPPLTSCNFYRPTGAQLACFTAMLPGGPVEPPLTSCNFIYRDLARPSSSGISWPPAITETGGYSPCPASMFRSSESGHVGTPLRVKRRLERILWLPVPGCDERTNND